MKIKGRPKAARNEGRLSFMEETILIRPDKSIKRAQSEQSISISLEQRISKSLFDWVFIHAKFKSCSNYHRTAGLYEPFSC